MDKFQEEVEEIIEHKITKVNGEVGFKKYAKGKLLGKGIYYLTKVVLPNAMKA